MRNTSKKTKKNNQPIGVFDSGVGGLSVLIELKRLLPHENFVFLADQFYVPYGEKTKKELIKLGFRVVDYLSKYHKVKMVVVACNTSTCNSIQELRKKYSLPIVGTVPAIRPAAKASKTGTIAIIATPSTSKSQVLKKLIRDRALGMKVINIGCKNLENVVEEGKLQSEEVTKLLTKYLKGIKDSRVDQLVLGCTHYPFLKKYIRKIVGLHVKLVDGNKGIAKRTKNLLKINKIMNTQKRKGETTFFTTKDPQKFTKVASDLLGYRLKARKVKI